MFCKCFMNRVHNKERIVLFDSIFNWLLKSNNLYPSDKLRYQNVFHKLCKNLSYICGAVEGREKTINRKKYHVSNLWLPLTHILNSP